MICLAAGALVAGIAVNGFTLAWTHSIEKIRWEEDWRVEDRQLVLHEARIRGTGAGMEPPEDAVLSEGVWRYRPRLAPQQRVALSHSPYAGAYTLCAAGHCRTLSEILPGLPEYAPVVLTACG